ncbi:hypothetical protein B0H17DRAFT_1141245 [Mycena rosella]|uniref:DUF7330 domain-containing protein n=1 Tax=Mycena rosella TaxID=1033263 RepID=A0AAD7D0D1_MYCRO|nr:hypothetical protein B0H17DRAFT_1141245 [Mycena rosella]
MIIGDTDAPAGPPKASTPLLCGSAAPPDYAPRGTGPTPTGAVQVLYQPVYPQQRAAFPVAFGIWILASALLWSIIDVSRSNSDRDGGDSKYPVPPDVGLDNCLRGLWPASNKRSPIAGLPYSAELALGVPLPSETSLLLLSKGALSVGSLKIATSSEFTDVVGVNVVVHYATTAVRDTVKVCFLMLKSGDVNGVGIFTPQQWSDRKNTDRLYFEVQVTLPRGRSINSLTTDVDNFSQDLDYLKGIVDFKNVLLQGSNGRIHVKTLGATNTTLQTTNGEVSIDYLEAVTAAVRSSNNGISGTYHVRKSLDLTTTNGIIKAAVGINGSDSSNSLIMHTSNRHALTASRPIDAIVRLSLDTTSGTGGRFFVKAETTNGRLATRIASAPLDSSLVVHAQTSNAPGSVALPSTYEGSLLLATSNAGITLQRVNSGEQDPACKARSDCNSRTRTVETREATNYKREAVVYWEKKNSDRGAVTLQSTNGVVAISV